MTKAEQDFIDEYARKLLVDWAKQTLAFGQINDPTEGDKKKGLMVYFEYAIDKGWVGKSEPRRVTAKGFSTAAAFLRR